MADVSALINEARKELALELSHHEMGGASGSLEHDEVSWLCLCGFEGTYDRTESNEMLEWGRHIADVVAILGWGTSPALVEAQGTIEQVRALAIRFANDPNSDVQYDGESVLALLDGEGEKA